MADSSAQDPPTEQVEKLHLDEVTGEKYVKGLLARSSLSLPLTPLRVSKTELKRRQKLRARTEKKEKNAAAAPPPAKKATGNANDEMEKLDAHEYYKIRTRQIEGLLKSNDPNPYPHKFHVNYDAAGFVEEFGHLQSGDVVKDKELRVAGRVFNIRRSGAKLIFYDVRTGADTKTVGTRLQVMAQQQYTSSDAPPFEKQHEHLARGDIVGIVGFAGRTSPKSKLEKGEDGELSIFATEIVLLSPSLHMLPTEHYGFKDHDTRFRQRYLDLLFNDASRQVLWKRSQIM
jgi:lysyl-tRNA synthetase, class II